MLGMVHLFSLGEKIFILWFACLLPSCDGHYILKVENILYFEPIAR